MSRMLRSAATVEGSWSNVLSFVGCCLGVLMAFSLGGPRSVETWTVSMALALGLSLKAFWPKLSRSLVQGGIRGIIICLCLSLALLAGRAAVCDCVVKCCGTYGEVLAVAVFFSVVLVCIGLFLFCCHRHFRNWRARVAWFALIFVWFCVTFYYASAETPDKVGSTAFANRVVSAFSRVATDFLVHGAGNEGSSDLWRLNCQWLQMCIALYVFSLLFSFFGRAAFNGLRIRFTLDRHKNVFWGLSDRGFGGDRPRQMG